MAEQQMTYARKASGLVRGLSFWDTFQIGLMNQGVLASIWAICTIGLGIYATGNLIIAALIAGGLAITSFPIVWGVLGGTMPRSGGEYIYNSRILHPVVGIVESFATVVIQLLWVLVLAPFIVSPGLSSMGEQMGWSGLTEVAGSTWGMFAIASVANMAAFVIAVFGVRVISRVQRVVFGIGMLGSLVMLVVLTVTSRASFVANWDALAAEHGSLDYASFPDAVGAPVTWNWVGTLGIAAYMILIVGYAYYTCFVGGEVKNPDKTLIKADWGATALPVALVLWFGVVAYKTLGFSFLSAASITDLSGGAEGYTLPFLPNIMNLTHVAWDNPVVGVLVPLAFVAFCFWWVVLPYLAVPRILFAWGMDRMGPKWFTDISPRWATPVKTSALTFVVFEMMIALYTFWLSSKMAVLTTTGLQIVTLFGITAVSALLLPYLTKTRSLWDSSPFKRWKVLGIPVITLAAIVNLAYLSMCFYFMIIREEMRDITWQSLVLYGAVVVIAVIWYFVWRLRDKAAGIDLNVNYGSLPPD